MKKIYTLILAAASLWMVSAPEAKAQSGCPQIVTGAVLTAAQWNNCFARKQDYLGYVPLNPSNLVAVSPITLTSAGGIISLGFDSAATSFVFGPVSSTDNAIARFDGTTGKLIQNSNAILGDSGTLTLSVPANTGLSITDTTVTGLLTPNTLLTHSFALGTASSHPLAFYTAGALAGYFGIDGSFTVTPQATSSAHGLTIYQTGITSGALPAIQSFCQNQGGAYYAYNEYCVTDRASVATLGIMPPNPSTLGVAIGMDTGGVNSDWNKVALSVTLQHIVASNAANLRDNVALGIGAASYASEGGTDTAGGAKGTLFGIGCGARLKSGATNYFLLTCAEIASAIETGASTRYRWGMAVANTGDLQAADIDAGIAMGSGGGLGFKYGLFFTNIFGTTTGPVTLCLICDDGNAPTIANGILSSYNFTTDFINLRSGVFQVANSGALTIRATGVNPLNIFGNINTGLAFSDGTGSGSLTINSFLTRSVALGSSTNIPVVFYTNNTLAGYFDTSQVLNLGSATVTQGKMTLRGLTSGTVTQTTNAIAGTGVTITWGTGSGTPAVTASAPLAIDSAGNITCSGCSGVATLTNTHIFVGNASNVATDVALSGDATMANTGAMTIANNAITFAKMQAIGANTIMGNPTAGSVVPSALSAPSCSTSASALIYITNTGFNCNSSIAAASAPVSGLTGAGTGILTWLATPSSANLAAAVTDETGTGLLVFATNPVLTTPNIGTPSAGVVTNLTGTASININGTVGASSQTTGQFTSLAYSTTLTGTSTNVSALAVGRQGATTPAFSVDASTASQTGGLKVTGSALNGTVSVGVTDTSGNTNLTINALGSGTIGIGSVSTGAVTITPALTLSSALTYGGVTLSNSVTGTASMVLSASPTFTGTLTNGGIATNGTNTTTSASSTALTVGRLGATTPAFLVDASTATSITGVKIKSAATGGGVAISAIGETNVNTTIDAAGSGTLVLAGTSTGAITLTRATTISQALTYGGVTLSNAVTGTGNMALSASPTFTGTLTAATITPTTINAFTLGGTISGGGNQINNVVIGTTTPLAGSFTSLASTSSTISAVAGIVTALTIKAGGNTSGDAAGLDFTSLAGTVDTRIFADAAGGGSRIKSLGDLFFHAGNIGFSATNQFMQISTTGAITMASLGSDTAQTDSTLCITSAGLLLKGTGTLGICLGTSGEQFKMGFAKMRAGLSEVMQINLQNYWYRPGYGDGGSRMQYGTTAQNIETILPDLVRHDGSGETINYDSGALLFISLHAIQQLKADNDNLRSDLLELKRNAR